MPLHYKPSREQLPEVHLPFLRQAAGLAAARATRGSVLRAAEEICQVPLDAGRKMTATGVKCSQHLLALGC